MKVFCLTDTGAEVNVPPEAVSNLQAANREPIATYRKRNVILTRVYEKPPTLSSLSQMFLCQSLV